MIGGPVLEPLSGGEDVVLGGELLGLVEADCVVFAVEVDAPDSDC